MRSMLRTAGLSHQAEEYTVTRPSAFEIEHALNTSVTTSNRQRDDKLRPRLSPGLAQTCAGATPALQWRMSPTRPYPQG